MQKAFLERTFSKKLASPQVFLNDFNSAVFQTRTTCRVFFRILKELFRRIDREIYLENISGKTEIFKLVTENNFFSTYAQGIQDHRNCQKG